MQLQEVLALIASGEGQTVEFKQTTGTSEAATRTLAAFASQPQGGAVIFGVNSDGSPHRGFQLGLETSARLAGTIKAKTLSMTTGLPLAVQMFEFRTPDRLVACVPPGADTGGPYLADGFRWQRVGSSTNKVQIDYQHLARVYQQHLRDDSSYFGIKFCPECGSQDFQTASQVAPHDVLIYIIRCKRCDWSDWSE
ncbi:AlbA family DNA-binding domain-containing protein [Nocardia sputorum]|uniref:Schlafen AlbA-2 domain-containing protein n=1 Tax=Nocardia sputorum TaxID=2984338 RepID=A0ABM8CR68_9NOCA|nr:RNA-binding domain-containing protein [Nocardia sputorum]BDT97316.1 hypothetical protein IFM12276_03450 [Nocardia sputorum]